LDMVRWMHKSIQIFTIILLVMSSHIKTNIKHCWNYFETGHGKGEHDGVGACIKQAL